MDSETHLLFLIIYQTEECTFSLPQYDTVGDLKNRIYEELGVAPYKQSIECWHKKPSTDSNTLITCCLPNECNTLVVYNIENDFEDNYGFSQQFSFSSGRSNNEEYVPEDTEISSVWSFKEYFSRNYHNPGPTFPLCTLREAFEQSFTTSSKRILILYFHNKHDYFSRFFCDQITDPNLQRLLNKFFLLCWDIENDDYKAGLIKALHQYEQLKTFSNYIKSKTCCALLIALMENEVVVINVLKGKVATRDFLVTLETAENIFNRESVAIPSNPEQNETHKIGPIEYQQLMLDLLGDRDYNSYDHFEHEFLKNAVGYAFFGPPKKETGYEDKQMEIIEISFKKILQENNLVAKWRDRVIMSVIYVCMVPLQEEKEERAKKFSDYDSDSDLTPTPVFVLRKCKNSDNPCRIFIDDTGRVYSNWENYLEENKLPKCEMVYPRNGRYEADNNGNVILDRKLSPACDITNAILKGTDIASAVGGIASGGVMIAAASIPAVAAAPFVVPIAGIAGIAIGAYSLGRSAFVLHDRTKHKESLSFFESPEARGAYINIVAGSLGFVGTGANLVVSKLAAEGFNIGTGATAAVNTLNVVNIGAGGVGVVNASYDVLRSWIRDNETPSLLTIVQLSSSILFFGHAVYNYRSINTVIEESQTNTLREYQESLRSNRHRKALNKLVKETIRQNDGNVHRGRAEVISTIKNIQNKDEVFAFLTRNNKAMNKNNVRFAASNGEITLNGIKIDMAQFSNMQKNDVITFLTQLPSTPKPTQANVKSMEIYINKTFEGISVLDGIKLAANLAQLFGSTEATVKEKIINAAAKVISSQIGDSRNYMKILDTIFPNHTKYFRIIEMVNSFFQRLVNEVEERFQRWKQTRNPADEEPDFCRWITAGLDVAKRATEIFNTVTTAYYAGTNLTEFGLNRILDYFYTWVALQIYEYQERQTRRQQRMLERTAASKKPCTKCGGEFYCPLN